MVTNMAKKTLNNVSFFSNHNREAKQKYLEELNLLLAQGVGINDVVDTKGNTLLHIAAKEGNGAAAEVLLRFGADPHLKNHKGMSPIQLTRVFLDDLI